MASRRLSRLFLNGSTSLRGRASRSALRAHFSLLVQTIRKPQKMWIMDVVWPITALYMGPFAVYLYKKSLPVSIKKPMSEDMKKMMERHKGDPPTWIQNSLAVFNCGAGCSIGDTIAELIVPALALTFAGEFGTKLISISSSPTHLGSHSNTSPSFRCVGCHSAKD